LALAMIFGVSEAKRIAKTKRGATATPKATSTTTKKGSAKTGSTKALPKKLKGTPASLYAEAEMAFSESDSAAGCEKLVYIVRRFPDDTLSFKSLKISMEYMMTHIRASEAIELAQSYNPLDKSKTGAVNFLIARTYSEMGKFGLAYYYARKSEIDLAPLDAGEQITASELARSFLPKLTQLSLSTTPEIKDTARQTPDTTKKTATN
jgi:hypothetical protein